MRESVRLVASVASQRNHFHGPELQPHDLARWRALRTQVNARHEANIHIASHVDLLMFGAGTRAERERVFIEIVEGIALLAFVPGGIPRMPQFCEAHDAQAIASAFAAFKETEYAKAKGEIEEVHPDETET